MHDKPPTAPFAKLERAKRQIDDVEARVQAWVKSRPFHIEQHVNLRDPAEVIWSYFLYDPPEELSIIVGEALHNIRTPLDNVLSAIAERNGGSSDGVAFPFNNSANAFEKHSLPRQRKLLPAGAIEIIVEAKPYPGGNDLLWSMNELNRLDKHRADLVSFAHQRAFLWTHIMVFNGDALILGDRAGTHMTVPGYIPSPRPPRRDNEVEFFTGRPGVHFEIGIEPLVDIEFGRIVALRREPVAAILRRMRDLSEDLLQKFARRFFG